MEGMLTIVSGEAIDGGIEELGDSLSRPLSTETRTVRVVVHEGDLLGRLVRGVEVPLGIGMKSIGEYVDVSVRVLT